MKIDKHDEVVDIVDENDNIIGQELKSKCHSEKILHRGGAVLCFKDDSCNEVLLTKRSENKSFPGRICFPGGHIKTGESYETGALREFTEEVLWGTDIKVQVSPLFKVAKKESLDPEIDMFFKVIYPGPFFLDREEVCEAYFEKIEKVFELSENNPEFFIDATNFALTQYKRYLGEA